MRDISSSKRRANVSEEEELLFSFLMSVFVTKNFSPFSVTISATGTPISISFSMSGIVVVTQRDSVTPSTVDSSTKIRDGSELIRFTGSDFDRDFRGFFTRIGADGFVGGEIWEREMELKIGFGLGGGVGGRTITGVGRLACRSNGFGFKRFWRMTSGSFIAIFWRIFFFLSSSSTRFNISSLFFCAVSTCFWIWREAGLNTRLELLGCDCDATLLSIVPSFPSRGRPTTFTVSKNYNNQQEARDTVMAFSWIDLPLHQTRGSFFVETYFAFASSPSAPSSTSIPLSENGKGRVLRFLKVVTTLLLRKTRGSSRCSFHVIVRNSGHLWD